MAGRLIAFGPSTPSSSSSSYSDHMSVDMDINEIADLKLGQEVVLTVRGCIGKLESGDDMMPARICIAVDEKKLRKTGNSQAEGIKKLAGEDTGDSEVEGS